MKRFFLFLLLFSLALGSVTAQEVDNGNQLFSKSDLFFGVSGLNQFLYSLSGSLPSQAIVPDGYNCDTPSTEGQALSGKTERVITHVSTSPYEYKRYTLKDLTRGGIVGAQDVKRGESVTFSGLDATHTYQWFSFGCTNLASLTGATAVGQVCFQGKLCQNTLQDSNGGYLCDLDKWQSCTTSKCSSVTSCESGTPTCLNGIQKCENNKVVECINSEYKVKSDCGSSLTCQEKTGTTSICLTALTPQYSYCLSSDKKTCTKKETTIGSCNIDGGEFSYSSSGDCNAAIEQAVVDDANKIECAVPSTCYGAKLCSWSNKLIESTLCQSIHPEDKTSEVDGDTPLEITGTEAVGEIPALFYEDLVSDNSFPTDEEIKDSICTRTTQCEKTEAYRTVCMRQDRFESEFGAQLPRARKEIYGDVLSSLGGCVGGAVIGGAAGTAIPIVGNIAGAALGGIAGCFGGGGLGFLAQRGVKELGDLENFGVCISEKVDTDNNTDFLDEIGDKINKSFDTGLSNSTTALLAIGAVILLFFAFTSGGKK